MISVAAAGSCIQPNFSHPAPTHPPPGPRVAMSWVTSTELAKAWRDGAVFQGRLSPPAAARLALGLYPQGGRPGLQTLREGLRVLNNLLYGTLYGATAGERLDEDAAGLASALRAAQQLSSPALQGTSSPSSELSPSSDHDPPPSSPSSELSPSSSPELARKALLIATEVGGRGGFGFGPPQDGSCGRSWGRGFGRPFGPCGRRSCAHGLGELASAQGGGPRSCAASGGRLGFGRPRSQGGRWGLGFGRPRSQGGRWGLGFGRP